MSAMGETAESEIELGCIGKKLKRNQPWNLIRRRRDAEFV